MTQPLLLSIIELGGYPNFAPLYRAQGYNVEIVRSVRKALASLKKTTPDVVVAEFNFQSDFRDRTSNLETLMAVLEQRAPRAKVIVFYEKEYLHQFEKLKVQYNFFRELPFPIDETMLNDTLSALAEQDKG